MGSSGGTGTGAVSLSGTGSLSTGLTYIGYDTGPGTFTQNGGTIEFRGGARLQGGFLDGFGSDNFGLGGATFTAVTINNGANVGVNGGPATFKNVVSSGAVTIAAGRALAWNGGRNEGGTLAVSGTANTSSWTSTGIITVNNAGALNNSGSNLVLGGGSRTTINAGGALSTATDTSIELNGALFVNNGTQNGDLHVNYGASAKGSGFYGNVTVGDGGQFGNNGVAGGASPNVSAAAPGLTPFWRTPAQVPARVVQPFIGPQLASTPGTINVQSLTLGTGRTFNFQLQNTQEAAGVGYDLTHAGGGLTLTGSTTAGNQIVIRLIGLDASGNNGAVVNFDASRPYQFTLVQADGGINGYTPGEFAVNTAAFANGTGGGSFSVVVQGNNLVLVFAPVPEPGTWAILALAGGALACGGWTRRTASNKVRSR